MGVLVGTYGRTGRTFHRIVLGRGPGTGVAVDAINDPAAEASTLAFLLEHDSVYGGWASPSRHATETSWSTVIGRGLRLRRAV